MKTQRIKWGLTLVLSLVITQAQGVTPVGDLPRAPQAFTGKLEPSEADSTPVSHQSVQAPSGAPNVLVVLTDDIGFAASSAFGGSIPTPNLEALAERGLKYNQFHTIGVCSPTRAALLTGRNPHSVGAGYVPEATSPYPGYEGRISKRAAPIARILRDNGFNTAMFGKEHNVPNEHRSAAGPFDYWPNANGFEYFFGLLGGNTDQWRPSVYENNVPVDNSQRPDGYLLDRQLADKAIHWIHKQKAAAPDKPFFLYYAPGTAHAPQQAPKEWIAKFRGKFDHGWDKEREIILQRQIAMGIVPANTRLTPRPDIIPAWDSLTAKQKKVYARYMEVFAAVVAYQDAQFGRITAELERMGIADNTLVIFIEGDNGSSGEGAMDGSFNEILSVTFPDAASNINSDWLADNLDLLGGPESYQVQPVGWSFATSTPFSWFKHVASHLGAVRNGMVISWPDKIAAPGAVRSQYHHVIDVLPTILEATGVVPPARVDGIEQQPIEGVSMLYSLAEADTPSPHVTQYYEVLANRAIYHEGWLASTTPRYMPWDAAQMRPSSDVNGYAWELYDLRTDFNQSNNLAAQHPDKLAQLQALFDQEARKYQVYPLQDSGAMTRAIQLMRHNPKPQRSEFVYWGPDIQLTIGSAPPIFSSSYTLEAEIEIPKAGGDGVLVAAGSRFGGWSFYLDNNKPVVSATSSPQHRFRIAAKKRLPPGHHRLRFDVTIAGVTAEVKVFANDALVAEGLISERPRIIAGLGESFDIGRDSNVPVTDDYQNEGIFSGTIQKVTVKVKPRNEAQFF